MKYINLIILGIFGIIGTSKAQKISFTEFDLPNGLHVILHANKKAPVVAVSVMYHVGSKDENPERTGFAHFFEHLLFEGSDNLKRGEFMKTVSSNGGDNNANTSADRTYYYEIFPSNQLELGLWLESERMLHPKIDEIGVSTQRDVIKEEKRMRVDNQPYGKYSERIFALLFEGHPYRWQPIGSMEHLDAAKLSEFQAFFKKFYAPNNAVLTISGDIDEPKIKQLVEKYFNEVPKGADVNKTVYQAKEITKEIVDTVYDANIQLPAIFMAYRVPGMKSRDSKIFEMVSALLSGGASSRLNTELIDQKRTALQVQAFYNGMEDYGVYTVLAIPNNNTPLGNLLKSIDTQLESLKTDLITNEEYEKLMNQFENSYVNGNTKMIAIAERLSDGYTFHDKNTDFLNQELDIIKSITKEDIRQAAIKYFNKNQRVVLYYLPKK
jgi:zinc protease